MTWATLYKGDTALVYQYKCIACYSLWWLSVREIMVCNYECWVILFSQLYSMVNFWLFSEECLLEEIRGYHYLTHGHISVSGEDDVELYRQVMEAMDVLGFTKEDIVGKQLSISIIYHSIQVIAMCTSSNNLKLGMVCSRWNLFLASVIHQFLRCS